MRSRKSKLPGLLGSHTLASLPAVPLLIAFLAPAPAAPARSQESRPQTASLADAARNAREHRANSTTHPKIITNDDLDAQRSGPGVSTFNPQSSSTSTAEESSPPPTGCDSPEAQRLKRELQAAQQQLDQLRRELSYQPQVISGNDLDLQHFRPGFSGFYVGAPPLLESQPPITARVSEAEVQDKIASLTKALRLACEYP